MKQICITFAVLLPLITIAQHTYIDQHSDLHRFASRMEVLGNSKIHSAVNQYSSRQLFQETIQNYTNLSLKDQYFAQKLIRNYPEFWSYISEDTSTQFQYLDSTKIFYTYEDQGSNPLHGIITDQKPLLKYFYKNRNYLTQIHAKGFLLKINPVLFFGVGNDFAAGNYTFENRRGIVLSGHINDKIYFYSDILESQAAFPTYINRFISRFRAIPGYGFYKNYNSVILGDRAGYDFLNARAYINARLTKGVGIEFGNGRHFLGNGNRSLLLSDFSNNYLYLKANTSVWKLHYQNIWAELIPISVRDNPGNTVIPRKYSATHYLSFKHKGLELGLFESIIFERDGKFDLQYLNPVILYRLVEYNLDSSDNVLIGANGKFNFFKQFQLYGQLLLDEFKIQEFFFPEEGQEGWWATKYGIQAGGKYFNVLGIDNLDFQLEYNRIRPFTYGHRSIANYAHANQSLAHPLGANLQEINFAIDYYITPKLRVNSANYLIQQGLDLDSTFIGENVLVSSDERASQFGHTLLQGNRSNTFLSVNSVSYEFFPNYFLDLKLLFRQQALEIPETNTDNFVLSGAIRINFWEPKLHF